MRACMKREWDGCAVGLEKSGLCLSMNLHTHACCAAQAPSPVAVPGRCLHGMQAGMSAKLYKQAFGTSTRAVRTVIMTTIFQRCGNPFSGVAAGVLVLVSGLTGPLLDSTLLLLPLVLGVAAGCVSLSGSSPPFVLRSTGCPRAMTVCGLTSKPWPRLGSRQGRPAGWQGRDVEATIAG